MRTERPAPNRPPNRRRPASEPVARRGVRRGRGTPAGRRTCLTLRLARPPRSCRGSGTRRPTSRGASASRRPPRSGAARAWLGAERGGGCRAGGVGRTSTWASSWLENAVHGRDVMLPALDLRAQPLPAFRGEGVVLRAAVVLRHAPLGVDRAGVLEATERLVERGVDDTEVAVGALVDPLAEGEAVHRLAGERTEDEKVECAVQEILRFAAHAPSTWWRENIQSLDSVVKSRRGARLCVVVE